ncbi:MAG TPA: polynucleotide kinase-phosphatase [Thermomicrobiaceae bacterium]|nr:polynucleotide kinase-phosphatase [Thermomicrobiaceae bacterium]
MSTITIPELSLVVLIGPSGAGKSTFARRHFRPTEILSSDVCRGLVADDENDQAATGPAFEVLHFIAAKRLEGRRLVVVDATNVQPAARQPLLALAREYHVLPVAIVLDLPEALCHERNRDRPDRTFGPHVVRRQAQELRRSLRHLRREGFRYVYTLSSPEEIAAAEIERQPLWTNRAADHGPFDIVGDVHGCFDELTELLDTLGYQPCEADGVATRRHPAGRKAVFLGDLIDRGPATPAVLRLVMGMVAAGDALCLPGNHDVKLVRKLKGRDVRLTYGLAETVAQLEAEPAEFRDEVCRFLDGLVSHYLLDGGKLVVAHAGLTEELQGRASGRVRDFALYGETTGETDEFGLPVRVNWAAGYRGRALVVYGHTPVPEPAWLNETVNIDTGCAFGGSLTALRYPERELVSVPARRVYAEPVRPLRPEPAAAAASARPPDLLDLEDVSGKRILTTRLQGSVTIQAENAAAALEVMSRFAVDPRWLIYLPPTMSPSETSRRPELLEHPEEAFAYYRQQGVERVIVEEKHMGSRAVLIACRDEAAARRFVPEGEALGACYTRTGRRFFQDAALEAAFFRRVRAALTAAGFWERFATGWVALDCELLPWSLKARELIERQYAPVGAAAEAGMAAALAALGDAAGRGLGVQPLLERFQARAEAARRYGEVYRRYEWPVSGLADLRLAPFHILATEGAAHIDRDHRWHMETLAEFCRADDGLLLATPWRDVELADDASRAAAVAWWEKLTGRGGEGMVVKPLAFAPKGEHGLIQPAIKCRGREYLRIIYGLEYTLPDQLERLRARRLGHKRSLALREFALGIEALERFTRGEPLYRVHECVFGVLALESEPVDPRL